MTVATRTRDADKCATSATTGATIKSIRIPMPFASITCRASVTEATIARTRTTLYLRVKWSCASST